MKTSPFYYALLSTLFVFSTFSHPGGTDANGGHFNRKTGEYHYHGGGPARPATKPSVSPPRPAPLYAPALVPSTTAPSSSQKSISDTSLKRLIERAEAGDTAAQYQLGDRYLKGDGVPKDIDKAREWFAKSAKGGSSFAHNRLGTLTNETEKTIPPLSQGFVTPAAAPSAVTTESAVKEQYWITTSSSKRHNSRCRYFQNSKGRAAKPNEGIACLICGG